jgi:gamma-tubulin complex component 2
MSQPSQGLKGVEALTLDYRVGWPVSLVISRRAITKYQLLSRLLYFSKHVELKVLTSWQEHQSTRALDVRSAMGQCYCLRHRMLHFLQNFVYYMTLEVIGPRSHEMHTALSEVRDMDQVLDLHERFLDTCLKQCLLASQDLLKILTKLMTTCLLFADQMKKFISSSRDAARNGAGAAPSSVAGPGKGSGRLSSAMKALQESYIRHEVGHPAFQSMLVKFEETFSAQLREFLERLWTDSNRRHPQLSHLCVRLDYNGFYTDSFAPEILGGGVGSGSSNSGSSSN